MIDWQGWEREKGGRSQQIYSGWWGMYRLLLSLHVQITARYNVCREERWITTSLLPSREEEEREIKTEPSSSTIHHLPESLRLLNAPVSASRSQMVRVGEERGINECGNSTFTQLKERIYFAQSSSQNFYTDPVQLTIIINSVFCSSSSPRTLN